MKTAFKFIGKLILFTVLLILILGVAFLYLSPQFGGTPSEEQMVAYAERSNYDGEIFYNIQETNMDMSTDNMLETLQEFMKDGGNKTPEGPLPMLFPSRSQIHPDSAMKVIWFGHSAFLVVIDGKNILFDPMFGEVAAPHPWLGSPRYNPELPIGIDDLPEIDAVFFSHDHYDHLDHWSVLELTDKVKHWYVPLGVENHLIEWNIAPEKVTAMAWGETADQDGLKIVFTPSRHFSGRGLTDRFATLWGSWVVQGKYENLYFSGDGGYGDHFKEIGNQYGPFDLALMECGQYNEKWAEIHMMPEQTAQAAKDVNSKVMMPIHWGQFTLALHAWNDPVIRVTQAAESINQKVITPKMGAVIQLSDHMPMDHWWMESY